MSFVVTKVGEKPSVRYFKAGRVFGVYPGYQGQYRGDWPGSQDRSFADPGRAWTGGVHVECVRKQGDISG